jgi:trimeric autotransporter adhesin
MKYLLIVLVMNSFLTAETLFEVKDSANNPVLNISTDGLRVMNLGDTLMVISSDAIRANIGVTNKGLSRSFSVTTASSKGKGLFNALEIDAGSASMTSQEGKYTDFSPKNIFIGLNAGASTTIGVPYVYSGLYNLYIGNFAGEHNTSGYFNTITGYMAGNASTTSTHNTFYGYQSGMNNTTGSYNTAIGFQAGFEMSGGYNNNVIGYRAGYLTSSGHDNVFIGTEAGRGNSSGNFNVALGFNTGYSLYNGSSNIFMGNESGLNTGSGSNNIFLGYQSGLGNTSGNNNIFMGYQAGQANGTGSSNQFMGYRSGQKNTSGTYSLFLGYQSGQNNTTGSENLFVGHQSGNANTTGLGNVCLGTYAGQVFTTGSENVMIGRGAGAYASTSASNNVFIGSYAGYGNGANTGNVFIGYKVGYNNVGSNKLMIDNYDGASATTSLIYGDFATDILTVNGTLKVKTLEIADLGSNNLGLDGDIVPYGGSSLGFDLGNNVAGEYWDDVVALEYITYSDRNTKDEVKTINRGLSEIMKLRPVSYRYKKEISREDKIRLGLIAQEVEEIIPEAVVNDDVDIDPTTGEIIVTKGQYKGMNYDQLIPVLIKAVQEQQQQIEELKKVISDLAK